jgi:hypothetical protein
MSCVANDYFVVCCKDVLDFDMKIRASLVEGRNRRFNQFAPAAAARRVIHKIVCV